MFPRQHELEASLEVKNSLTDASLPFVVERMLVRSRLGTGAGVFRATVGADPAEEEDEASLSCLALDAAVGAIR